MICKICGSDMINNGDWLACPVCGSVYFGEETEETKSEADPYEAFKNISNNEAPKPVSPAPTQDDMLLPKTEEVKVEIPDTKEVPLVNADETVEEIAEPIPETAPEPITEADPDIETAEPDVKIAEPEIPQAPVFPDEKEIKEEKTDDTVSAFEENYVKFSSFTGDKAPMFEDFASFNDIEKVYGKEKAQNQTDEEAENVSKKKKKKKKSKLKDIVDFMLPIVAAIVIAFVLKTFIIANAKVPTGSMISTINIEDRIIASRLAYQTDDPQRYDIVLFYYPDNESDIYVKRVLGLPGETLEVIEGVVYVTTQSGKTIQTDQSFVNPAETPSGNFGPYYIPEKGEKITVEGDYCYAENGMLMGEIGFLDKYCVKDARGNYVIADNLYFMMGDNRNYSSDSRAWTYQFVSKEKIIGKVLFKYYPKIEKIQ